MADRLGETRDFIIAEATRRAHIALSAHAIPAEVNSIPAGTPGTVATGSANQFVTGYSGGVTVSPFQLDFSLLDGPDRLAV